MIDCKKTLSYKNNKLNFYRGYFFHFAVKTVMAQLFSWRNIYQATIVSTLQAFQFDPRFSSSIQMATLCKVQNYNIYSSVHSIYIQFALCYSWMYSEKRKKIIFRFIKQNLISFRIVYILLHVKGRFSWLIHFTVARIKLSLNS